MYLEWLVVLKDEKKLKNQEEVFTIQMVFLYLMIVLGFLVKSIVNRLDQSTQVTDFVYQQF